MHYLVVTPNFPGQFVNVWTDILSGHCRYFPRASLSLYRCLDNGEKYQDVGPCCLCVNCMAWTDTSLLKPYYHNRGHHLVYRWSMKCSHFFIHILCLQDATHVHPIIKLYSRLLVIELYHVGKLHQSIN